MSPSQDGARGEKVQRETSPPALIDAVDFQIFLRYAQELNLASMLHLKIMLRQMLTLENIPNVKEWEETLLKFALRIAREMTFTALPHRQGEDMDVRRYVKIKKIPGGSPRDSEYVDGAVITKNVAHKQMARFLRNPRIMLVTFPLEFYRAEGQYMHFGQIVRQEKEYLGNLASRIAALRPHIVLVEKSVSRLALEALAKHNIAVARTVKPSSIQCIARMTQGDIFSSMDKLALEPRLGHCARFRIQTYDHRLIPGQRKTYMRFEGCNRDMGCTIILRGEDIGTLRRIKKVTRFLTFIVRNLKLETHLWKDSVITLPSFNAEAIPTPAEATPLLLSGSPSSFSTSMLLTPTSELPPANSEAMLKERVDHDDLDLPDEDAEQLRLSRRIQLSLEPYTKTFISVSATLRFPPPYPIIRMKELDDELMAAKRAWEDEVVRREEKALSSHVQEATITPQAPSSPNSLESYDDIKAQIEALPAINLPVTPTPTQSSLPKVDDSSESSSNSPGSLSMQSSLASLSLSLLTLSQTEALTAVRKTVAAVALESRLSFLKWQHEEQRRIWEWYLRKNNDDFVVEKYQCISLLQSTIPLAEFGQRRACFAPQLKYITFYGENDCTLGQYIEKAVSETLVQSLDPKAICAGKGCNQPLARHCKVYVHHETRLLVAVEQWDGQIVGRANWFPSPDLITTWSACRVCGSATPFIPVSEEMQRYSFAKFLELHFYPADVKLVQGAGCQHNIYQHHIRYFACKGMTVRFQTDRVTLHEIVYPSVRVRVCPETQLELKNADFDRLHCRNILWYTALIDDLKLISIDAATGDEEFDAHLIADVNALIIRAEAEREEISQLINRVYTESSPTDTLALNQVRSFRQDKIVAWQQDFDRLPKPRPVQTVDKGSRKTSAFGSVRAIWPGKYGLSGTLDYPYIWPSGISEVEDRTKIRRVTGDSFASSASEASEPETNVEISEKEKNTATKSETEDTVLSITQEVCKSDPDSDSTIEAVRDETNPSLEEPVHVSFSDFSVRVGTNLTVYYQDDHSLELAGKRVVQRVSRLPRRATQHPTVKELVQKYQNFLPADGVQELAKTAFPLHVIVSESEPEYGPAQPRTTRSKSRHNIPSRQPSISDFEQGYAANVAPRYLTHSRRTMSHGTRIPGPVGESSLESSRLPSPEKGHPHFRAHADSSASREASKHMTHTKPGKVKPSRPARPPPNNSSRTSFRRVTGPGNKVSSIAKHFERINRDNERANRRYAVIRGRRARPVASARARVEILDSIKDAINDESESSDSSEADDEGDGNDEDRTSANKPVSEPSQEQTIPAPEIAVQIPPPPVDLPSAPTPPESASPPEEPPSTQPQPVQGLNSLPPSPFLTSTKVSETQAQASSELDVGPAGAERISILKAISGLWVQQQPQSRHRMDFDADDPMSDPEHIFRDSSMVVRTDEPTSIIALALKYVLHLVHPFSKQIISYQLAAIPGHVSKVSGRETHPRTQIDGW
jgi:1-phosphatidylinositol-3-phosphate 5-kinase